MKKTTLFKVMVIVLILCLLGGCGIVPESREAVTVTGDTSLLISPTVKPTSNKTKTDDELIDELEKMIDVDESGLGEIEKNL